jgi:hypothetical protein
LPSGTYPQFQISELERIARRLLEERFPEGVPIPIDIDYLAESEPGVSLDIMPGLRHDFGIAGAVVVHPKERQFTILIDQSVADGNAAFYRFTLAEEFSHLVLHRSVLEQIETVEDAARLHASPAYYDHLDRNAKWLASALLMPEWCLQEDARALFSTLRTARLDEPTLTYKLTIRLAQRYNVSQAAMSHRLRNRPLNVYDAIRQAFAGGLDVLP